MLCEKYRWRTFKIKLMAPNSGDDFKKLELCPDLANLYDHKYIHRTGIDLVSKCA